MRALKAIAIILCGAFPMAAICAVLEMNGEPGLACINGFCAVVLLLIAVFSVK